MRRLFRWIAGLVSVAALAKLLSGRRRRADHPVEADGAEPDPAEELRRKLEEVRSAPRAEAEAKATTEPPADAATADAETGEDPAAPASIEERRAAIHARAQEAIDAMKEIAP